MRNKQTYENTITSKLEALPLPDMADAIWSRIEAQLDIDLPTDDGGGNSPAPDSPTGFGWIGGSALFILAAGIISFFYFSNDDEKAGAVPVKLKPPQTDSVGLGHAAAGPPKRNAPIVTVPLNSENQKNDSARIKDSSNVVTSIVVPPASDTLQQVKDPPLSFTTKKDSSPPGRRPRGVKGITDDDYKIVPKKDTAR